MRFQEIEQLMNRVGLPSSLRMLASVVCRYIDVRVCMGAAALELFTAEFFLCQTHDYFLFQAFV